MTTLSENIGGSRRVIGGPFGSKLTTRDYTTIGVPVIRGSNMEVNGRWIGGEFAYVSDTKFRQDLASNVARPGSIIVTQRGTLGQVSIVPDDCATEVFVVSQSQMAIDVDSSCACRDFVYYFLRSPQFTQYSHTQTIQTGVPHINLGILRDAPADFPPLPDQREIAAILGALDDKIELNRKTAATLEEMARALYRSWFVDFDPVWAKAEGRAPVQMDEATAALFPDSFGDDGLPVGWKWVDFSGFYDVLETGKRPKGGIKDITEGVPSIGAESIKNIGIFDFGKTKHIPREFFESMRKGRLCDGDILIYKDGGKPGELKPAVTYISEGFPFQEACINEHVFRVRLSAELGQHFGFLALSSESCMKQMRELATGVAQPGLNQSAMKALSFIQPLQTKIIKSFNAHVEPLLDGCNEKAKESHTLASLRNAILPKLMSGEIRVGKARELVEEVV